MKKLILSLGVLAALAAPAAAGRLDVETQVLQPNSQTGIDYSGTSAISQVERVAPYSVDGRSDKQRGAQGSVFGANGR